MSFCSEIFIAGNKVSTVRFTTEVPVQGGLLVSPDEIRPKFEDHRPPGMSMFETLTHPSPETRAKSSGPASQLLAKMVSLFLSFMTHDHAVYCEGKRLVGGGGGIYLSHASLMHFTTAATPDT